MNTFNLSPNPIGGNGGSKKETNEDKKNKAEAILQEIENNRFKTLCDPGIFGIKSRLSKLDFISDTGESCCSRHPRLDNLYVLDDFF